MGSIMSNSGGWFQWNTKEDFNAWHDALCSELGYPLTEESGAITTGHTSCFLYEGVFIAWVDQQYASDLIPIEYIK